jgi:hypothetical protein
MAKFLNIINQVPNVLIGTTYYAVGFTPTTSRSSVISSTDAINWSIVWSTPQIVPNATILIGGMVSDGSTVIVVGNDNNTTSPHQVPRVVVYHNGIWSSQILPQSPINSGGSIFGDLSPAVALKPNSTIACAVGADNSLGGGVAAIWTTTDLSTWSVQHFAGVLSSIDCITWSSTYNKFIAIGGVNSSCHVLTSSDGITWSEVYTDALFRFGYCIVDNGINTYIIRETSGDTNNVRILTTTDSIIWTPHDFSNNAPFSYSAYDQNDQLIWDSISGRWLLAGAIDPVGDQLGLFWSTDFLTWNTGFNPLIVTSHVYQFYSICRIGTKLFAGGTYNNEDTFSNDVDLQLAVSTDNGSSWTAYEPSPVFTASSYLWSSLLPPPNGTRLIASVYDPNLGYVTTRYSDNDGTTWIQSSTTTFGTSVY